MSSKEQKDERSDARDDDQRTEAGKQKIISNQKMLMSKQYKISVLLGQLN